MAAKRARESKEGATISRRPYISSCRQLFDAPLSVCEIGIIIWPVSMKRVVIIGIVLISAWNCSISRGDYRSSEETRVVSQRAVRSFEEIPADMLSQLEVSGSDDNYLLTPHEAAYLNAIFKTDSLGFDFTNKRIWFRKGKTAFFEEENARKGKGQAPIRSAYLYVFSEEEKRSIEGIDAAVDYWCVMLYSYEKMLAFVRDSVLPGMKKRR